MADKPIDKHSSTSKKLAHWLDDRFRIPGTNIRFGLDPILGLFPGLGDWAGGMASLYFLFEAAKKEGRISILFRMLINILVDLIFGAVPVLGDLFDLGYKANIKNAQLLDELERDPDKTKKQSKIILWGFCLVAVFFVFGLIYLIGWLLISLIGVIL